MVGPYKRILILAVALVVASVGPGATTVSYGQGSRTALIITNVSGANVRHALDTLGLSWWFTFTSNTVNPAGYQKVLLVRTGTSTLTAGQLHDISGGKTGNYWIIGNEPNVPGQDNVSPQAYAQQYRDYVERIRSIDPQAKFVAPNVLNWDFTCIRCGGFTPGHQWVDAFRNSYRDQYGVPPPVDIWGIHAYVIDWNNMPMVNYQQATQEISALRDYLNGLPEEAGKPIWVTEFGVIWGYEGLESAPDSACSQGINCVRPTGDYREDLIADYLKGFVGWLQANTNTKNIQLWFLYTDYGYPEPYSTTYAGISLFNSPGTDFALTNLGTIYRDLALQDPGGGPAPIPTPIPTATPIPITPGGGGGGGTTTPTPIPTTTPTPIATSVSQTINVSSGGTLQAGGGSSSPGGVTVGVPPEAVAGQATVTLAISYTSPPTGAPPEGTQVGTTIDLTLKGDQGETITTPDKPLTITIRPTAADLEAGGGDINNFIMGRWDGSVSGGWEMLDTTKDLTAGTVTASTGHLTKFSVLAVLPKPTITAPSDKDIVGDLAPLLAWTNPSGTTQYHIQVIPYNDDGPGINLIRNVETGYQVQAPKMGVGNYVMLPGMSYTWRVRTTTATVALGVNDPRWSGWVSRTFRSASPVSWTLSPVGPYVGSTAESLTPTLTWVNSNERIFYYEVQLSKDPGLNTDPASAVAAVYWELVHGGESVPVNSYRVRPEYPLEPGTTYYWRVRPRVQGDGTPVEWSSTWQFTTP